jgi:hypothetical protein
VGAIKHIKQCTHETNSAIAPTVTSIGVAGSGLSEDDRIIVRKQYAKELCLTDEGSIGRCFPLSVSSTFQANDIK